MEARLEAGTVIATGDARQRFFDSRGYGRPREDGSLALAPVEAAHLLFRGDLDGIKADGETLDLAGMFEQVEDPDFGPRFLVYLDLRERGFYLSPARPGWVPAEIDGAIDLVVYERGTGPGDGAIAYRVRVLDERKPIPAGELGDCILAVVDEESEITYFETERPTITGEATWDLPGDVPATLLPNRTICWSAPGALYDDAFYGQPLGSRDEGAKQAHQLSLVETAHLVEAGVLDVEGGYEAVCERGRGVEGERFARRLAVYSTLRERGIVPKTGFKFGADFRTYTDVESVDSLGHSAHLVYVIPPDHVFTPREIALDVRLAHGVRKELLFMWPTETDCAILRVSRLTP